MMERLHTSGQLMDKRDFVNKKGKQMFVATVGWMGGSREFFVSEVMYAALPEVGTEVAFVSEVSEGFDGKLRVENPELQGGGRRRAAAPSP